MSADGLIKGAVAGAGAALLVMYLAKRKKTAAGSSEKLAGGSKLNEMSDEKLAELKDSIEDIIAEREAK